jgi:hypothetical protein
LVTAAVQGAWPDVDHLDGKFVLCLSGHSTRKSIYAATNPKQRLCFADSSAPKPPLTGDRAFFNFFMPPDKLAANEQIRVLQQFAEIGLITRSYGLDGHWSWDRAQRGRSNILATDHVTKKKWARPGCNPFEVRDGPRSKQMEC